MNQIIHLASSPMLTVNVARRGNTLLITMLVITSLVAIMSLASDRMRSTATLTDLNLDRGRASLAAESMAALIEGKLIGQAGEVERLKTNVEQTPSYWWNLDGCWYANEQNQIVPATRGLWINGCLVRWRIEPVALTAEMPNQSGTTNSTFTVNREPDPDLLAQREAEARSGPNQGDLLPGNPPYFHYRIVTEAYAMNDPNDVDAMPWATPGNHSCAVQVQRVVQLNLVNLFAHVVFYAARGETGDLELDNDADTSISGSLHSNGAVFLGGSGDAYLTKNYKGAATDGGLINLGNATDKVDVTGVMGVFRLRKVANYHFASSTGNDDRSVLFPKDIPKPNGKTKNKNNKKQVVLLGDQDLNGGYGNSNLAQEKVSINGLKLTFDSDSRNDWSVPENQLDPHIRDAQNGGAIITTLANIPELASYPLEAQRLVGENVPLYRTDGTGNYTINPGKFPAKRLFYTNTGNLTTDPLLAEEMVFATDLPLFRFIDTNGRSYEDVWPAQPQPGSPASPGLTPAGPGWPALNAPGGATALDRSHTFLPEVQPSGDGSPSLGYYLAKSLHGEASDETGLTIRERGQQNISYRWARTGEALPDASGVVTAICPLRTDHTDTAEFVRAYGAWLKSQYAVYLGKTASGTPIDITDEFFDFGALAVQASGNLDHLVATQDQFMNRREAQWLKNYGYFDATASGVAAARAYRTNVLTLHLDRVFAFMTSPRPTTSDTPSMVFNGLIYVHRTPRLSQVAGAEDTYNPLAPLRYNPVSDVSPWAPDAISNCIHTFLQRGTSGPTQGNTIGTPNTWVAYPSNLAIRIAQGARLNWGGTLANGRVRGLTIVTPDHCYVQGSYNTLTDGGAKPPPSAIFADAITVLSNLWTDSANNQDADYDGPLPRADACQFKASIMVNNLPTDYDNLEDLGSGGVHNVVRFLEDWQGENFDFSGSLVVLNRMRYNRTKLGANTYFRAPTRSITYNPDLLTEAEQPPFSPIGVKQTRVVHTLNVLNQ